MPDKLIKLPRFARDFLRERGRCRRCYSKLFEADVTSVGAGRDGDGSICFSYEVRCAHCKRINTIIDATRKFTDPNWWEELGQWHEQALDEMGPFDRQPWLKGAIRMLVGPAPLTTMRVHYGYRGDVGPVILRCHGSLFCNGNGSCRLERLDQIRLLTTTTDENMPTERWWKFKETPEGAKFAYAGRTWTRLTRAEIEEILRDRVFTCLTEKPVAKTVTTEKKKPPREHGALTPKSGKGARRASHDAGKVDSRRRRPSDLH